LKVGEFFLPAERERYGLFLGFLVKRFAFSRELCGFLGRIVADWESEGGVRGSGKGKMVKGESINEPLYLA
jgi:hypothetical protein